MQIETERLILRPFRDADATQFAALNTDPEVMHYFPAYQGIVQTRKMISVWAEKWATFEYGFSAVIFKDTGQFIGMTGLNHFEADVSFAPCTEIGWRFSRTAWGHGYATEAAEAWLKFGFGTCHLDEIYSFAPKLNLPSLKVMARLGMTARTALDFDHPAIEVGHRLRPMAVYSITKDDFSK